MVNGRSDATLEWLRRVADFRNPIPIQYTPFVRTVHINDKRDGCFICPSKSRITRHHIRRGRKPLAVYLCWTCHQIIHGIALHKHKTEDIMRVLISADRHNLYKEGEAKIIKKMLLMELDRRRMEEGFSKFITATSHL